MVPQKVAMVPQKVAVVPQKVAVVPLHKAGVVPLQMTCWSFAVELWLPGLSLILISVSSSGSGDLVGDKTFRSARPVCPKKKVKLPMHK